MTDITSVARAGYSIKFRPSAGSSKQKRATLELERDTCLIMPWASLPGEFRVAPPSGLAAAEAYIAISSKTGRTGVGASHAEAYASLLFRVVSALKHFAAVPGVDPKLLVNDPIRHWLDCCATFDNGENSPFDNISRLSTIFGEGYEGSAVASAADEIRSELRIEFDVNPVPLDATLAGRRVDYASILEESA